MTRTMTRREAIQTAAASTAALTCLSAQSAPDVSAASASIMDLRVPKMDRVRVGSVGLGKRGLPAIRRLRAIEGVEITALCDLRPERVAAAQKMLADANRPAAKEFGKTKDDWKQMCGDGNVDLVYNATPRPLHAPIAIFAMKQGKHAASEVPAARTLEECWQLVDTAEATQRHCMMLENCCYGETELMFLRMCREGVLGELMHGDAAYIHDTRELNVSGAGFPPGWRLDDFRRRVGNVYPTHGLGPIAQYMGINRGDRFDYMVSMSSNERGMTLWAESHYPPEDPRRKATYTLGDMNTSLIRTVKGRTIMLQNDMNSPRPYSRLNLISGTKGCCADYPPRVAIEPKSHHWIQGDELKDYYRKYAHPLWARVGEAAKKVGGHGGMDFVMDWRLIYCLRNGEPLDQSVYDAAAWSAIGPLSDWSVANGASPVEVPDFTRGVWETTPPLAIVGG